MTYLHRLAARISRIRVLAAGLAALGLLSCTKGESTDYLGTPPNQIKPTAVAVSVNPHFAIIKGGERLQFSAAGVGSKGENVPVTVTWMADGGSIDDQGWYTAVESGPHQITAWVKDQPQLIDSARVAIWDQPADVMDVVVTPDSTEILAGEGLQFVARAQLASGETSDSTPLYWSSTGGDIDGSGWFVTSAPGTYDIEAAAPNGVRGRARINVRDRILMLTSLRINPGTYQMGPGQSLQFDVTGTWTDGSRQTPNVVWSSTGGSITANGLFTATSFPGPRMVIVRQRQGTIADTAIVTVVAPTVDRIVVSPATPVVAPGGVLSFSAAGVLSDGTSHSIGVNWTVTGGTMSLSGIYTAGSVPGTYLVIGTVPGTAFVDSSVVTIQAPSAAITQVILNPSAVTLPMGGSRQMSVTAVYSNGATGTPVVAWSATGGTISASGNYVAGNTAGSFRVIAVAAGGVADTAGVTITAPTLTSLTISPSGATVLSGLSQQFQASGTWSDGSTAAPPVTWISNGGTINATGLFVAGAAPGTFTVIAGNTASGIADTSLVTVTVSPPVLQTLVLTPGAVSLPSAGVQQFQVSGTWVGGGLAVPAASWSATGGTISGNGLYTAGSTPGTYRVIAQQVGGSLADTSVVTISTNAPTLASLSLTPDHSTLVTAATRQYNISANWSDGSHTPPTVAWSANGGTVTNGGLYVAGMTPGNYWVIARHQGGTRADTAEVMVTAGVTLTGVVLTPASASVATSATRQFSAVGSYSNGGTGTVPMTWTATGGTISSSGLYTAGGIAGTFRVIARLTAGTFADTSVVTVTGGPGAPTLASVEVSPTSVSVAPGGTQAFSALGRMSDASTSAVTVTWTATGGSVSAAGVYTAGAVAGTYSVIGSLSGGTMADTSAVTITAAPPPPPPPPPPPGVTLTGVEITPSSAQLFAGGLQLFTAIGRQSDGSTTPVSVTWSGTGGLATLLGLYTAGMTPGSYRVIAVLQGGTMADTAAVTIYPPVVPGVFPAAYDPNRLGSQFVLGNSWQSLLYGSDNGYSSVMAAPGGFRQSAAPYPSAAPGEIMLDPDPIFGKVVKFMQPDYHKQRGWAATLEKIQNFATPANRFWYRAVVRLDGNGNPNGFTSQGTGFTGGSTTWKMMFVFTTGDKNRMEVVLMASGGLQPGFGQTGDNVSTATALTQGGAPVAPLTTGWAGEIAINAPGTPGIASNLLTSKEWFEVVMNFEQEDATHYIQRYFVRQLTTGAGTVWAPRAAPTWRGLRSTVVSGVIKPYYRMHLGGNKSQSNDGPNDQWVRWGPWEITTHPDPYGWDRYGK